MTQFVLSAAFVLLAALSVYAIYLGLKLRRQRQQRETSERELAEHLYGKEREARQSVQIIARALVQKDLSETEAAMRIAWLSKQITLSPDEAQQVSVFQQLAVATAHIPILDDWAALSKIEQLRLDVEREEIVTRFREFVHISASQLISIRLS